MRFCKVISHLNIIFGGLFIVFFFLDTYNPEMEYIGGLTSKVLLLCFCACALLLGIVSLMRIRKKERRVMNNNRQSKAKAETPLFGER